MKKFLSLLTALLLLLSPVAVAAEGAMEASVSLKLDAQTIGGMVQYMGGVTGEEELAMVSALLGLVNSSSVVITAGENGAAYSLRLKDAEAASFLINVTETGLTLTSSMFPGYSLSVSPELLGQLAGSAGMQLPAIDMAKAAGLLIPYGQDVALAVEKIISEAKVEEGTFTPDGTAAYTQCRTVSLTSHTLIGLARGLVARTQQDQELLGMLEPFIKMTGESPDVPAQLAAVLSQMDAMLAQEPFPLAELRLYSGADGTYLRLESASLGDIAFLLTVRTAQGQDGSASQLNLTAAEAPVADWAAVTQDLRSGKSMEGLVLDGNLDTRPEAGGARTSGSFQLLAGGMNGVLSVDSFAPADASQATVTKVGLGLGGSAPLAEVQFSVKPVPAEALALPEGKTDIAVRADMTEKDLVPLLSEMIGIGLPRMLTVLTEQAPEVMNALLKMAMSQAREAAPLPDWTVPGPADTAAPEEVVPVRGATAAPETVPVQEAAGPGKLTVTQATLQVTPYSSYYQGTVHARVENTGTTPVEFDSGTLELLDAAGNVIGSESVYGLYPEVLAPGETGYMSKGISVEAATEPSYIAGYNLVINGREEISKNVVRLPASGKYEEVADAYWSNYYLSSSVENGTDGILYDPNVVFAMKDAGGNLLYITQNSLYGVGVMPHSSVAYRTSLYSDILDYFSANSLVPDSVDVIAYVSTYK